MAAIRPRPVPERADLHAAGWALPAGFGRPHDAVTRVGTLDRPEVVTVDARGALSVPGHPAGAWSLDWWVGADDRWHLASQEASVRQSLVAGAPVVESRLRIPGGDAVHRVFGVAAPGGSAAGAFVVVEVTNETPVPFALALVVRPFGADGRPLDDHELHHLELRPTAGGTGRDTAHAVTDDDGTPLVVLARRPARVAAIADGTDLVATVLAGDAPDPGDTPVVIDGRTPTMALVVPVPHTLTYRVLVPLGVAAGSPVAFQADLPDAAQVSAGWAAQIGRTPRTELPETRLTEGLAAARCTLLLTADRPEPTLPHVVAAAAALDAEGLHDEAARILAEVTGLLRGWRRPDPALAAATLGALARHWAVTRDDTWATDLLPEMAALARRSEKAGDAGIRARHGLADVLVGLGQPDAAARARPDVPEPQAAVGGWAELRALAALASGTWAWPAPGDEADRVAFLRSVRGLLLAEDATGLTVLPDGVGPWWGQGVELHDAPTRFGTFSFAVRWHGERPALLWDLTPHPGGQPAIVVRAPVVDPTWSSPDLRGEALLAVVPRPSEAGNPVMSEPAPGQGSAESMAPRSVLPLAPRPGSEPAAPPPPPPMPPPEPGESFT